MGSESRHPLSQNLECSLAPWAPAIDCEVGIEGGRPFQAEPLHDGKTCSVHEREVLIGEVPAHGPGGLEVCGAHGLEGGDAASEPLEEGLGCSSVEAPAKQGPTLSYIMM